MGELTDLPALFARLTAARIRAQIQYRMSFALQTLGMFLVSFLDDEHIVADAGDKAGSRDLLTDPCATLTHGGEVGQLLA